MLSSSRKGEALILLSVAIGALYPLLVSRGVHDIPPLQFTAMTTALAALGCLCTVPACSWRMKLDAHALCDLLIVSFCIVVIPSALIALGTIYAGGINASLLLQMELPISFLLFVFLWNEKPTLMHSAGALIVLLGNVIILFRDAAFAWPGLLLIAATTFYPFGNRAARRLLVRKFDPAFILFCRNFIAIIPLSCLTFLFESQLPLSHISASLWLTILMQSWVVLALSKLFWYHGLKNVPLLHAIFLLSAGPVFSLLFAIGFFGEWPLPYQWIGFAVTLLGLVLLTYPDTSALKKAL